eukprot:6077453-Pleurochrysis_carterae.AAC.2
MAPMAPGHSQHDATSRKLSRWKSACERLLCEIETQNYVDCEISPKAILCKAHLWPSKSSRYVRETGDVNRGNGEGEEKWTLRAGARASNESAKASGGSRLVASGADADASESVSYTHLTLPTILLV